MHPFQERRKLRKILYAKTTLAVLVLVLVLVARGAWGVHEKALIARAERAEALASLQDLSVRSQELQESLERLKSDQGVEEELRQKFAVAKSGEEVVVVVDETAQNGKNTQIAETGFWDRFVAWFR